MSTAFVRLDARCQHARGLACLPGRAVERSGFMFRQGSLRDLQHIQSCLLREKMNPVGIHPSRFILAEDFESQHPIGFGQMELKSDDGVQKVYELRSLVVDPERRGNGVGKMLVEQLLFSKSPYKEVWLTTTRSKITFYEQLGFSEEAIDLHVPKWLWIEMTLGSLVAPLAVGEPLVVMKLEGQDRFCG
ncbi:hypothetical protein CEUSTIGMA_g10308.t1 [Chlamydomonas eustigma]|uniref:N-acetyltransferase domain-containing protein n=1 Tax=Chlamydomonas eustigma TaxID=1157962 RepID=A0A250XIZ5_9CHLO|nr:hypothetical protein CEUSTIGMA_g10308.t1 [Chlamydomonas eustigma]|eukprot:GAX82882.1 hypothetical protein CEUSTIGMA_g10308.t1 [Chlamydomonas eustigma]